MTAAKKSDPKQGVTEEGDSGSSNDKSTVTRNLPMLVLSSTALVIWLIILVVVAALINLGS